jgi:hypothetical protein
MSGIKSWTREMKKIEREFDGLPPLPSPAVLRARRASQRANERRTLERTLERRERIETVGNYVARIGLVGILAVAINFWPYSHACGVGLATYLGAATLIVVGGLWTAVWAWQGRMALVHGFAMTMVVWGLALVTAQVLPRTGYAAVAAHWTCGS